MGFIDSLMQTYAVLEKNGDAGIAPTYHKIWKADIEITLNADAEAIEIRKLEKNELETIIPATSASKTRTSAKVAPFPLSDQVKYLADCGNSKYITGYLEQLGEWMSSEHTHAFLPIIYKYVSSGTIGADLEKWLHKNPKKEFSITDYEKKVVRWVVATGDPCAECWKNKELIHSWQAFYEAKTNTDSLNQVVSILDGSIGTYTELHEKAINTHSNGKLISKNDDDGFTYRGRFTKNDIILPISEKSSFELHQALRWVVGKHGLRVSKPAKNPRYLCVWMISEPSVEINPIKSLLSHDKKAAGSIVTPLDQNMLKELYAGQHQLDFTKDSTDKVVVAVIGGRTDGRLSLEDYSEFSSNQLFDNFAKWDFGCQWETWDSTGSKYVKTPSFYDLINCSAGVAKINDAGNVEYILSDARFAVMMRDLVQAKIYGSRIPLSIVRMLTGKADHAVDFDPLVRKRLEFTTRAALRKYYLDYYGKEFKFMLDETNLDRSYLFGRLLAVYRKAENDVISKDKPRPTRAERMQSAFAKNPTLILQKLDEQYNKVWKKQLTKKYGHAKRYDLCIENIMAMLANNYTQAELRQPLEPSYLFGLYAQYESFFKKTEPQETE